MMSSPTHFFSVTNLGFSYPRGTAVCSGLSFGLAEGEIGCLLGPSGCGKTTVLRLAAGLEIPSEGEIQLAGSVISKKGFAKSPEQRGVGVVFQDYALFPHLTVNKNVAFGLKHLPHGPREERVLETLNLVGLTHVANKYPHELSGGQQQRVALARSLAPKPRVLLMDEPFSNLDTEMRERLSLEVREILKSLGTTVLVVTHDQHEAFAMADRIGVMNHGRIEQWDAPYRVYHEPTTRFVADFVGQGAFLKGTYTETGLIDTAIGALLPAANASATTTTDAGKTTSVLLRPDDVQHDDASPMTAEVITKAFRGAEFLYTLKVDSGEIVLSLVPSHHNHAIGERIGIRLDADHVVAFSDGLGTTK